MYSTHYMDLLMQNSPWNLIFFMAIPVILAETVAITELVLTVAKSQNNWIRYLNRCSSILGGVAFVVIIAYLIPTVVIPLAQAGEFRTWVDATAIFSYLAAGIPMILLACYNIKHLIAKFGEGRNSIRILLLAAFLVLSHIAMIFGMVDPGIAGYSPEKPAQAEMMEMHHHH
ncbi:MAG: hypothetical protein J6Z31_09965 [Fibrobacter sp.]|nr:hypothetical protein [Fibrobacter sp.]